jgi:hypothetical protein
VAWLVLGWPVAAFGFDVEIVAADACEGLTYSAIKQSPYLTSTGTQYADHPNAPFFDFVHHYYAGTKLTVGTGNGCFVGTYRIKLWTDRVEHIKE